MNPQKQKGCVQWFLQHNVARTFIFQFSVCAFMTFIQLSTYTLPPFEGHPNEPNRFHILTIGLLVYCIICFAGPISGAHINPAITLAVYTEKKREKDDYKLMSAQMAAHFIGCTLGCIFNRLCYGTGGFIYTEFPDGLQLLKDCAEEFVGTFLLILFIFIICNEETTFVHGEAWTHLIVSLLYYLCLSFSSHFKAYNPAIIFSNQIQGMMFTPTAASTLVACLLLIFTQYLAAWVSTMAFSKIYLKQTRFWKQQAM